MKIIWKLRPEFFLLFVICTLLFRVFFLYASDFVHEKSALQQNVLHPDLYEAIYVLFFQTSYASPFRTSWTNGLSQRNLLNRYWIIFYKPANDLFIFFWCKRTSRINQLSFILAFYCWRQNLLLTFWQYSGDSSVHSLLHLDLSEHSFSWTRSINHDPIKSPKMRDKFCGCMICHYCVRNSPSFYISDKSSHVSERSHSSLITLSPSFEQLIGLIYHREPHTNPKLFTGFCCSSCSNDHCTWFLAIHTQLDGGKTFHWQCQEIPHCCRERVVILRYGKFGPCPILPVLVDSTEILFTLPCSSAENRMLLRLKEDDILINCCGNVVASSFIPMFR